MKPIIRAAVDSGRPPLELILDEPNRKRCKWDGKLIKALYLNEAFEVEGYPIWIEESPDISFVARTKIIRSAAVVEKAQDDEGKKKNPRRGVRFYAEAKLAGGATWPTRRAWMERHSSRPAIDPEDTMAAERIADAEERAKAKVQENPEIARIVAEAEAKLKSRTGKMEK